MNDFRRLTPRTLLLLGAVSLVLLAVALRFAFSWYLRSDAFQRKISAAVGHALKANGAFLPLHYADGTFYSDGFKAEGGASAFFSELRADQIRALFNWGGMLQRRWQIDELTVQQLDVQFVEHPITASPPSSEAMEQGRSETPSLSSAWRLDLRAARVAQSSWRWGRGTSSAGEVTGSSFTLTPSGDSWLIDAKGGRVSQTGWPALEIDSARLRYNSSTLFITETALRGGTGRITVDGEVNFRDAADLQAQLVDVPADPLLPSDWRARLSGKLAGRAKIHASLTPGTMRVEGNLLLSEGQVEALPLLDQIATFTHTERFRRMSLSKASLSFIRDGSLLTARDVVVESEGLLRAEGSFTVRDGQIDGLFQIGVTSASLQWLPGSQARVFTVARDGYFWTTLHLTGPVAHPKEDLTPRLLAAAAGELMQNSQDAVLDTAKSLLDLIPH
ncbi:MAG: AsmA-like C-terminal region-containing protein [Acidobacteriota bacterium]|nr:AsmA-like C-terminal region-containing protein [Acidobacteriota bacterium]